MSKKEMINFIEQTNMVIDFDEKYLMRQSKERINHLYALAVEYQKNKIEQA